jgi:hypothetical protein
LLLLFLAYGVLPLKDKVLHLLLFQKLSTSQGYLRREVTDVEIAEKVLNLDDFHNLMIVIGKDAHKGVSLEGSHDIVVAKAQLVGVHPTDQSVLLAAQTAIHISLLVGVLVLQ